MSVQIAVEEGIATLTLQRGEAMNSLDGATAIAVQEAVARLAADPAVRVLILAGEGPVFSAGGDFNWVLQWPTLGAAERDAGAQAMMTAVQAIYDFPKPSIARVHGAAVGGGIGMMLACDFAIASTGARFGLTSARNGLIAAIAIPVLIEAVGPRMARQLLLHGGTFDAHEAERIGLVDRVVEADVLDIEITRLARELKLGAPSVQALIKSLVPRVEALPHDKGTADMLAAHVAQQCVTEDALEGMRAFLEKRKPRWAV